MQPPPRSKNGLIAVTNDDGATAAGLRTLVATLTEMGHAVVCFANQDGWSGAGTGLGPSRRAELIASDGDTWIFRGATPGLLAAVALSDADVGRVGADAGPVTGFISGVNYGPNVGHMVLHSGTVGAALTAFSYGVPAVAVSCDDVYSTGGHEDGLLHYGLAARLAIGVLRRALALGTPMVLNLNVPSLPPAEVRGLAIAELSNVRPRAVIDDLGRVSVTHGHEGLPEETSDVSFLRKGYATLTLLVGDVPRPAVTGIAAEVSRAAGIAQFSPSPP